MGRSVITDGDQGVLLSFEAGSGASKFYGMARVRGTSVELTSAPMMVALDESGGGLRWTVANDEPQVATADGGVIGKSGIVYDGQGMSTGRIAMVELQSWRGNGYVTAGSVESIVNRPMFEDGASFWPVVGGNPSGNGTAVVQCPCLLQSSEMSAMQAAPAQSGQVGQRLRADQGTDLIMVGDPGLNLGSGREHNVGGLFNLAADTKASELSQAGHAVVTARVSSFSDFGQPF